MALELLDVLAAKQVRHVDVERRVDRVKKLHLGSERTRQLCSLGDGRKGSCLGVLDGDENSANWLHETLHQIENAVLTAGKISLLPASQDA